TPGRRHCRSSRARSCLRHAPKRHAVRHDLPDGAAAQHDHPRRADAHAGSTNVDSHGDAGRDRHQNKNANTHTYSNAYADKHAHAAPDAHPYSYAQAAATSALWNDRGLFRELSGCFVQGRLRLLLQAAGLPMQGPTRGALQLTATRLTTARIIQNLDSDI